MFLPLIEIGIEKIAMALKTVFKLTGSAEEA